MDIKELEFIKNFVCHLDHLIEDLHSYSCILEEKEILTDHDRHSLWSINHQCDLMREILNTFKEVVDRKYWSEWVKKYPYINPDYDLHQSSAIETIRKASVYYKSLNEENHTED